MSLAVARGDADVRKLVVLKALLPELAEEPEAARAFIEEAKVAAQLNHPNVVQTFEVASEAGRHLIVMEYLDGQSLSRITRTAARGTGLPLQLHLRILTEVLEGLHYAHELKSYDGRPMLLVHRDVSPQNVIVTYDGQVKLLDFGIAKAATSSTHTAVGIMKGKIAYMAPEQMANTTVDRRADVYSAGCMLWAAATNQKLWQDVPDVQVVRAVVAGKIPSPRSVYPECPAELEAIVTRALHPDPDRRYSTAQEMQAAIEHFAESLGGAVRQRDLGRFVSQLFADSRAEFDESVERELATYLAKDGPRRSWPSLSNLVLSPAERAAQAGIDAPSKSGVARSKPKARLLLWGLGALVVVAMAVVSVFARPNDRQAVVAHQGAIQAPGAAVEATHAVASTNAAVATAPLVPIALSISPDTATLTLDGKQVESGTATVELPISDVKHTLVVEASGFETETRAFDAKAPQTISVVLTPKSEPKPARSGRVRQAARSNAATPTPSQPAVAPPSVRTAPPAAACDNPFYVDADGIKRVRPGCG